MKKHYMIIALFCVFEVKTFKNQHTNHFFRPLYIRTTAKALISRIVVLFQIDSVGWVENDLVESLEEALFVAGGRDV